MSGENNEIKIKLLLESKEFLLSFDQISSKLTDAKTKFNGLSKGTSEYKSTAERVVTLQKSSCKKVPPNQQ